MLPTDVSYHCNMLGESRLDEVADPSVGDTVCNKDDRLTYVFNGDDWEPVGLVTSIETRYAPRKLITKCRVCGASLPMSKQVKDQGYARCEWCRSYVPVWDLEY